MSIRALVALNAARPEGEVERRKCAAPFSTNSGSLNCEATPARILPNSSGPAIAAAASAARSAGICRYRTPDAHGLNSTGPRDCRLMLGRIGDRGGGADVHTAQRESLETQLSDHGGQVADSCSKTQVSDVPVGVAHPARVVQDHAPAEAGQPVRNLFDSGARSIAVATRLTETGGEHERRASAHGDLGDANTVAGRCVLDR